MSDSWYREPGDLPPYKDGFGGLWSWDGHCIGLPPRPEPAATWLDEWPEDLQWIALKAAVNMELADGFRAYFDDLTGNPGGQPTGILGLLDG
jgi:hypothetical protein